MTVKQKQFRLLLEMIHLLESLSSIGESPVKLHSMPQLSKVTYGKRKLIQINSTVKQKLAKVLCLPKLPIQSDNTAMSESDQKVFDNMQNLENPTFTSGFCSLNAVYISFNVQSSSRFCSY